MRQGLTTISGWINDISGFLQKLIVLGVTAGILFNDPFGVIAGIGLSGGGTTGTVTINLDPVTVALGGTGITAAAKGSVLIANAADTFSALSGSTDGDVLTYNAGTDTISWEGSVDGGTY